MQIEVVKSKIHRVTVTGADLNYIGSITIDEALMEASNIIEGEKVAIVNIINGERLETNAIKGNRNFGEITLNVLPVRKEKKGNTILRLPSPTYLAQILESLELDSYFQFMPTHELLGPDLYLQLISEGRIPISFIANEGIALLSYQNYFHDMFHHLFIWIYIPKKLKDLICSRAKTIVEFSKSIEQTLQTEELQLFWKLIIFRVGMRFDNATGTLNNKLFDLEKLQQRAFRASRVEEFNFIRSSQNITQIGVLLEAAINFGRLFSRDDKEVFAQTILDENEFLYQLFHDLVNSTAELLHGKDSNLKGAIHSQPEFDGLFDLNDRELRAIREHLLEEIMALTRYNPAQGGHLTNLISFDEFMKGISKQMNNLYGKTKSMKHRF